MSTWTRMGISLQATVSRDGADTEERAWLLFSRLVADGVGQGEAGGELLMHLQYQSLLSVRFYS